MNPILHVLPPMKRFRLQQNNHRVEPESISPSKLPTKKRKQSRCLPHFEENRQLPRPYCLPAKKQIWAFRPDTSPIKSPLSNIDLNVESNPTPSPISPSHLPTKKRRQSRNLINFDENLLPPINIPTPYCLPAKKRIWAFRPEISSTKSPLSKIDLNVEYTPSPEKKLDNEKAEKSEEEEEGEDGILCAVCESTDGDPTDPIVFCDGCELMVHSTCYGNPLIKSIPEGDWFCAQCLKSRHSAHEKNENDKEMEKCCLCPVVSGAMKPTNDGRWAHIVCAVLVPEVFFEDSEGRDGIDCSKVPKRRWKEVCYLCKKRRGCAIECSEPRCTMSFHVTCGLKEDLCIELKEGSSNGGIVAGFCRKHTEIWKKQQLTGKFKIVARD